jgi:hypothetical protein
MLDFAGPGSGADGFLARLFHSGHHLREHSEQHILTLMSQAGLADAEKLSQGAVLFGHIRINYYRACAPASEAI